MRYHLHHTALTSLLLLFSSLVIADNEDASILGDVETVSIATGMERPIIDITTAFEYSKTDGHEPAIDRDQQTLLDEQFGNNASLAPGKAS